MIYAPMGAMGGNVGIGFAVPSDTVDRVVRQIVDFGPNARPSLGVSVLPDPIRRQYAAFLQRELKGAVIVSVVPDGPAAANGLTPCSPGDLPGGITLGDMITSVNGTPVTRNEDLLCAVEEAEPDQPISLTLMGNCDPERIEEMLITPVRRQALMASLDEMQAEAGAGSFVPTPTPKGMWWGRE